MPFPLNLLYFMYFPRLVKGSGEIIEEVVSRDKQREINRMATIGDGLSYQAAQLSGRYEK